MAIQHITSCLWTVSMSLSRTVFKTVPLFKWTWLPQSACDLENSSFLTRKLKLQVTCAFLFMCKQTIVKSCFIYELQVLQRFQTTKVTFKFTQGHRQSCHSIVYIISYLFSIITMSLSCTVSEILSLISENLKMSRDRDHNHSRDSL